MPFYHSGDNGTKQVGNEHHPSLYLYGIYAVTIQEMQREIFFELLNRGPLLPISVYKSPQCPLRRVQSYWSAGQPTCGNYYSTALLVYPHVLPLLFSEAILLSICVTSPSRITRFQGSAPNYLRFFFIFVTSHTPS